MAYMVWKGEEADQAREICALIQPKSWTVPPVARAENSTDARHNTPFSFIKTDIWWCMCGDGRAHREREDLSFEGLHYP